MVVVEALNEQAGNAGLSATDIGRIYTPLDEAVIRERWPCRGSLAREVLCFAKLPINMVLFFERQPLVLWRYVASPNFEMLRFLHLAEVVRRPPLIMEMPFDRFTPTINRSKRYLAKLPVRVRSDKPDTSSLRSVRITDFDTSQRRRFGEMQCLNGTPFRAFHHDLCRQIIGPAFQQNIVDAPVFEGEAPQLYYERLFALFTCFGVLAENFVLDGSEGAFTEDVVIPAFEATVRRFGAKPMIVQLLPRESESASYWDSYPAEILPFALAAARPCAGR